MNWHPLFCLRTLVNFRNRSFRPGKAERPTFGEPILRCIRPFTDQVLDVHLMVTNPERHFEAFAKAGADSITFHYEVLPGGNAEYSDAPYAAELDQDGKTPEDASAAAKALIDKIHALGCKAGISIKPKTPVEVLFPILGDLDLVLVMTVEPGFGGQKYIPASTERIRRLREERRSILRFRSKWTAASRLTTCMSYWKPART